MTFEYTEESGQEYIGTDQWMRTEALKLAIQAVEINVNSGRSIRPGWMYDRADEYAAYIRDGSHPIRLPVPDPEES